MAKVSLQEIDERVESFFHLVEAGDVKVFFVMYKLKDPSKKRGAYIRFDTGTIEDRRAYLLSILREIFDLPDSKEKSTILFEVMMKIINEGLKITEKGEKLINMFGQIKELHEGEKS